MKEIISGLDHIALSVTDIAKSKGFYQKLGFKVEKKYRVSEHNYQVVLMTLSDVRIELLHYSHFEKNKQNLTKFNVIGIRHIALRTTNVDKVVKVLKMNRLKFNGPQLTSQGDRQLFVYDPDNIVIEFQEKK